MRRRVWWFLLPFGVAACAGPRRAPEAVAPSREPALPPLGAEVLTVPETAPAVAGPANLVTLQAVDADVRSLLVALAQVAGVNLIISSEVRGRLSLALDRVPAEEALTALMEAAGLSASGVLRSPWEATVFLQPPVWLDTLSAEAIARRFGVSAKLAEWIVEQRAR
ncbi:hypothetical protein HRbin33_00230 [bacterium HR33]|nr:hypothetical protein HRbin33_00230 [bacterium HR33]